MSYPTDLEPAKSALMRALSDAQGRETAAFIRRLEKIIGMVEALQHTASKTTHRTTT